MPGGDSTATVRGTSRPKGFLLNGPGAIAKLYVARGRRRKEESDSLHGVVNQEGDRGRWPIEGQKEQEQVASLSQLVGDLPGVSTVRSCSGSCGLRFRALARVG